MAVLKFKEIQDTAKAQVQALFAEGLASGTQFGTGTFAIATQVETGEGTQEVFVEVAFTAKNFKATKTSEAFDIDEKVAAWEASKDAAAAKVVATAKAKAEKEAAKAAKATK